MTTNTAMQTQTTSALTFAVLVRHEPRLAELLSDAKAARRTRGTWCANAAWYGYGPFRGRGLKDRLLKLVGWHRPAFHPLLSTVDAFNVAYQTVFDAIPSCSHQSLFC